jgi:uncharacterized membrane protein YoaK (UPF0700 family)
MLRHTGIRRTFRHNIRLAGLLSLTAGFVNVTGFLAFMVLTTNVTGHVALFAERLSLGNYNEAKVVALWMLMFFLGAFSSSLFIGWIGKNKPYAYIFPISIEILILIIIGTYGVFYDNSLTKTEFFAGSLLFAMGLQNALVSVISGSVVRTTHLTGMFTDLGIELAERTQLKIKQHKQALNQKILLRTVIISSFFLGGIAGGYLYKSLDYRTFYIPATILFITIFYDIFRVKVIRAYRKIGRYGRKS